MNKEYQIYYQKIKSLIIEAIGTLSDEKYNKIYVFGGTVRDFLCSNSYGDGDIDLFIKSSDSHSDNEFINQFSSDLEQQLISLYVNSSYLHHDDFKILEKNIDCKNSSVVYLTSIKSKYSSQDIVRHLFEVTIPVEKENVICIIDLVMGDVQKPIIKSDLDFLENQYYINVLEQPLLLNHKESASFLTVLNNSSKPDPFSEIQREITPKVLHVINMPSAGRLRKFAKLGYTFDFTKINKKFNTQFDWNHRDNYLMCYGNRIADDEALFDLLRMEMTQDTISAIKEYTKQFKNKPKNILEFKDKKMAKAKIQEPEASMPELYSDTEPYNEIKKQPFKEMVSSDFSDAAYRVASNKISKAMKKALVAGIDKFGWSSEQGALFIEFLDTEYGDALVATLLGYALTYIPKLSEDHRVAKVAKEFRVHGMATVGNEIISLLIDEMAPALSQLVAALPAINEPSKSRVHVEHPKLKIENNEDECEGSIEQEDELTQQV